MKYSETDLTETTKILSYLRSIQIYAVVILILSALYFCFKIYMNTKGTELYLLDCFIGVISLGSLSLFINLNSKTANIYGVSSIIAGAIFLFCILYYRGDTDSFVTGIGVIAGLIVIKRGVSVVFGNRSQEAFSRANQKKVSFVINLLKSLRQPLPNEKDAIHCTYTHEGKQRKLSIKLLDGVACFVLDGHAEPMFVDRNNLYISELQKYPDFVQVSITVENHDWLEAQFKPDDFKKYVKWKDL
jgi:hypothetical protein